MEIEKKEGEGEEVVVETVESLQEKIAQIEADKAKIIEERDNYKQGVIAKENELKKFKKPEEKKEEENEEEEEESNWDEASLKFQTETLTKSELVAEQAAAKVLEKRTEKSAQSKFLETHADVTPEVWEKVVANYTPQNGKDSEESIMKDLDRAYFLYRFDNNLPITQVDTTKIQGENQVKEAAISHGSSFSGESEEDQSNISDGQLMMATRMGVSKEALEKEDDSLRAEIDIVLK